MAAEESGFPGIVDVHAHLAAPEFEDDLGEVLDSAAGADLAAIVAVSTTPEDAPRVLSIAKEHSMVFPCIGLHPCDVTAERIDGILALLDRHADTIVGVGECGLDYMPRNWADRDEQEVKDAQHLAFARQIEFAKAHDLPLNIHSRGAGRHAIQQLVEAGYTKAVLHAFDGKPKYAEEGANAGIYFSMPASLQRFRSREKFVRRVPLDRMLLETDSPCLPAVLGERNEPKSARAMCDWIASVKGVTAEQVAQATRDNAFRLFPRLAAGRV